MDSWWNLGEWRGFEGSDLALHRITCPFCMERGNFSVSNHTEKRKPNSNKILNFDTLECQNCRGYVLCLWSAGNTGDLHEYRVLPWPLHLTDHPEHWPNDIGRYWIQAHRNLTDENWDAASLMARSALQIALRNNGAEGRNLRQEIESLAQNGTLPPIMTEWSHNIRELGNEAAHPKPEQAATNPNDAHDIVNFLDFLLKYLYDLPHQIEEYRNRRE